MTSQGYENTAIKPPPKTIFKHLEALGHQVFYLILRVSGHSGAYILLIPVVFIYVLCSRNIHKQTSQYRHKMFPKFGVLQHWLATFKLVHSFGQILVDRAWLGMVQNASLEGEIKGMEKLKQTIDQKRGIVLLTAHIGNWQTALSNISQLPLPINSLMHYEDGYVTKHFFELRGKTCPFHIINIDSFMGGMVEAAAVLQKGEIVTIMGDRYTAGAFIDLDFLGEPAAFPISAYALAAKTGASVAIMLAAKTGQTTYTLEIKHVFHPVYKSRETRQTQLKKAAQLFVTSLENHLDDYPYQWYNFYDFWQNQL